MKKILALVMAVVLSLSVLSFAGCSKKGDNVLILATSADFPPYEYMEGNDYAGIDIEIAQLIAEKLGMELQVENMNFDSIIGTVASGKAHIGMAGLTVTEEREKSVLFTDTYATSEQVIIVRKDSSIKDVDDIYAEGANYTFGVQLSTTGDIFISGEIDEKTLNGKVEQYKTGAEAVESLATGKIDCVVIDREPAKAFVAKKDNLTILETEYATEEYAICISKDNPELRDKVNKALEELKKDGSIDKIIAKYIPADK